MWCSSAEFFFKKVSREQQNKGDRRERDAVTVKQNGRKPVFFEARPKLEILLPCGDASFPCPFVFCLKRRSTHLLCGVPAFVSLGSPLALAAKLPPPSAPFRASEEAGLCDAGLTSPRGIKDPAGSAVSSRSRRQGGKEEAQWSVTGKEEVGRVWRKDPTPTPSPPKLPCGLAAVRPSRPLERGVVAGRFL